MLGIVFLMMLFLLWLFDMVVILWEFFIFYVEDFGGKNGD